MTIDLDALDARLPRVESALHGPAHPDEFRVEVGRYRDRWYHDPLPGCSIAPACDDTWPSVSIVKKAADRDWSWTSLERAAQYLHQRRGELDGLTPEEIHARLLEVNKAGLNRAAGRGTSIHHLIEALASGAGRLPQLTAEAEAYVPAARQFIADHQPEWVLSEAVVINRGVGYGGTLDAAIRLDGRTWLVDWKTRRAGKHAAYPEEAWQLAAYANAEYIIVSDGGGARRAHRPDVDGGLIVSIAPEGYRLYPVDLAEAWTSFRALRAFWAVKQTSCVGRPVKLAANGHHKAPDGPQPIGPTAELVAYRAWILGRLEALKTSPAAVKAMRVVWPDQVPGLLTSHQHTEAELEAIAAALDTVETEHSIPFPTPDPRRPPPPPPADPQPGLDPPIDEGGDCSSGDMLEAIRRIDALPATQRMVLDRWAREARERGVGFNIRHQPSQRRLAIYRACAALAPVAEDKDIAWAVLSYACPDNGGPLADYFGAYIGRLTIDQAVRLGETAAALTNGGLTLHYRDDGSAHLTPNTESGTP